MGNRKRRVNTDPMRNVVKAILREGKSNPVLNDWLYIRWYELTLDCGHEIERNCRYEPGASNGRRGWARLHHPPSLSKVLDPPKRARCEKCAAETRRAEKGANDG